MKPKSCGSWRHSWASVSVSLHENYRRVVKIHKKFYLTERKKYSDFGFTGTHNLLLEHSNRGATRSCLYFNTTTSIRSRAQWIGCLTSNSMVAGSNTIDVRVTFHSSVKVGETSSHTKHKISLLQKRNR